MRHYFVLLLTLFAIGCSENPGFKDPVERSENKNETVSLWLRDFTYRIEAVPEYKTTLSSSYKDKVERYSTLCELNPKDYTGYVANPFSDPFGERGKTDRFEPDEGWYHGDEKTFRGIKPLIFIDYGNGVKSVILHDDLVKQCKQSHEILGEHIFKAEKNGISNEEYKKLNLIYLIERENVIKKVKAIMKNIDEAFLKHSLDKQETP